MTLNNAIKKLSKEGFEITKLNVGYSAYKNHYFISFNVQNDRAWGFNARSANDESDVQTDYFAGVYCDNLSQAIRIANRN